MKTTFSGWTPKTNKYNYNNTEGKTEAFSFVTGYQSGTREKVYNLCKVVVFSTDGINAAQERDRFLQATQGGSVPFVVTGRRGKVTTFQDANGKQVPMVELIAEDIKYMPCAEYPMRAPIASFESISGTIKGIQKFANGGVSLNIEESYNDGKYHSYCNMSLSEKDVADRGEKLVVNAPISAVVKWGAAKAFTGQDGSPKGALNVYPIGNTLHVYAQNGAGQQAPAQQGYQQAPPQGGYQQPPAQQGYQAPPVQNGYQPPAQNGYQAPPQGGYQAPPVQNGYQQVPPAPTQDDTFGYDTDADMMNYLASMGL